MGTSERPERGLEPSSGTVLALTPWDISSSAAWSGVIRPMATALRRIFPGLVIISPDLPRPAVADRVLARAAGAWGGVHLPDWSLPTAVPRALRIRRAVRKHPPGTPVISLAATPWLMAVPTSHPIIQVTDSSFRALVAEYPAFRSVTSLTRAQACLIENRSAARTDAFAVASGWSRDMLARDVGAPADRIRVLPFGPAIAPGEGLTTRRAPQRDRALEVLFVGADWERKGGDLAVAAVAELRRRGHPARLTVIGGNEPELPDWVTRTGRVAPQRMHELYRAHDILLEPTRASAGGVAITDALSHGLPVLAHAVGGTPSLIQDGRTGWLVAPSADADALVHALESRVLTADLAGFSAAASQWAAEEASWAVWGASMHELVRTVVANRAHDHAKKGRR